MLAGEQDTKQEVSEESDYLDGSESRPPEDLEEVKQEPNLCGVCDMSSIMEASLTEHQQTHAGNQESASDISHSRSPCLDSETTNVV